MAPRTKQPETLKMEEVLQAFQTACNWKWHRNHAADPVGVSVSKNEQYLQAHKGLLMKLMEVSLVLNKLVIKQALECYDDAGLFSAGAKMEKPEFLDFQSYGFKVLLMEVRKKASRCTVESSRQPGYIKELIKGYRKQDAKNKKPGKQEQTSSPSKKRSWFISVKVGSPGSSDGYVTPQKKRKFDELSDVSPQAKSSCKKTKVVLSEMKPMKTKQPSMMKKAWHKRAMGS